jgi:hypothetical protein
MLNILPRYLEDPLSGILGGHWAERGGLTKRIVVVGSDEPVGDEKEDV